MGHLNFMKFPGKRDSSDIIKHLQCMDLMSFSQLLKTSKLFLGLRFYYGQS